jgi:hypothetical protein
MSKNHFICYDYTVSQTQALLGLKENNTSDSKTKATPLQNLCTESNHYFSKLTIYKDNFRLDYVS